MSDNNQFSWFSAAPGASMVYEMTSVKDFAYRTFDQLDMNGNGFLEWSELNEAMNKPGTLQRERQFIKFLIENQDQIADSFDEGEHSIRDGISRQDLEAYFSLILNLLSPNPHDQQ